MSIIPVEVQSWFIPSEIRAVCSSMTSVTTAGEGGSAIRGGLRSNESSRRGSSIAGSTSLGASTLAGVDTTTARAMRLPVTAVGDDMGSLIDGHETECYASGVRNHLHTGFTLDARSASSTDRLGQLDFVSRSRAQLALRGRALASIVALERRIFGV